MSTGFFNNAIGGMLGRAEQNYQNALAQAQQQQIALGGAYGSGWDIATASNYVTSGTIDVGSIWTVAGQLPSTPQPLRLAAKAESALEWLDRRVNEMRVAL